MNTETKILKIKFVFLFLAFNLCTIFWVLPKPKLLFLEIFQTNQTQICQNVTLRGIRQTRIRQNIWQLWRIRQFWQIYGELGSPFRTYKISVLYIKQASLYMFLKFAKFAKLAKSILNTRQTCIHPNVAIHGTRQTRPHLPKAFLRKIKLASPNLRE
jgi:hypothetical protein